jgi:general secretion pathway protein B
MSYILDALRRAEAERERGAVPGLHSVNLPEAEGAADSRAGARAKPALWLAAAAVLLVLAGGGWWLAGSRAPAAPAAALAPISPTAPSAAAVATAPAVAPPPVAAPPITAAAPVAVLQLPTPPTPAPAAVPAPSAPAAVPLPAAKAVAPVLAAPTPAATAAAPPATPAPGAVRTIGLAELGPELRRDWPPLVLGGSIYSDNPASRFVIANGQVVREGQTAAPGVVVERIGQRSVLLRWRELRVEVPL